MRNKLIDLNNVLFATLERLDDEDLTKEELSKEITRAKAITDVSKQIIDTGRLALDAQKHFDEFGYDRKSKQLPEMLTSKENQDA